MFQDLISKNRAIFARTDRVQNKNELTFNNEKTFRPTFFHEYISLEILDREGCN